MNHDTEAPAGTNENIILFANNLMKLRKARGLTQEEVALALEVSNKTVSKWEHAAVMPDILTLIKIAQYYDVSTDFLLGLAQDESISLNKRLKKEFQKLSGEDAVRRSYEIVFDIIHYAGERIPGNYSRKAVVPGHLYTDSGVVRSYLAIRDGFELIVNSKEVNLALLLLGNEEQFAWLSVLEKRQKIAELFSFLADANALKICAMLHTDSFPKWFTAEYMAVQSGIELDIVLRVLDNACEIELCEKQEAHFKEGVKTVYFSSGAGNILALVVLAYEYMCGKKVNHAVYGNDCKMIGGKI